MLRHSGWEELLSEMCVIDVRQFYLYGNSAYLLRPYLQQPFVTGFATLEQIVFNAEMALLRVFVEHSYRDLKQM